VHINNAPIICKLCGDTLRDGYDGYSDQYAEWGKTTVDSEGYKLVDALYVHCERCLTTNREDDDNV